VLVLLRLFAVLQFWAGPPDSPDRVPWSVRTARRTAKISRSQSILIRIPSRLYRTVELEGGV
jgi:hypothetical protein